MVINHHGDFPPQYFCFVTCKISLSPWCRRRWALIIFISLGLIIQSGGIVLGGLSQGWSQMLHGQHCRCIVLEVWVKVGARCYMYNIIDIASKVIAFALTFIGGLSSDKIALLSCWRYCLLVDLLAFIDWSQQLRWTCMGCLRRKCEDMAYFLKTVSVENFFSYRSTGS
jgi:hypothetical protein